MCKLVFFPTGKRRFCLFCWGELYFRVRKVWLEVKGRLLSSALCGLLGCPGCKLPSDMALGRRVSSPTGKAQGTPTHFVFLNGSCESRRTLGDRCWCSTQILPWSPVSCVPSGAVLCGLSLQQDSSGDCSLLLAP